MTRKRMTQILVRSVSGGAAAALLAGCAVSGPPRFSNEGAGLPEGALVMIEGSGSASPLEPQLASALERALSERGFRVADQAGYVIRYSLAERPARVALARQNEFGSVDYVSYARTGLLLDRCEAQRLRVNVVAYDLAESTAAYRGAAEFNDCNFERAQFDELAQEIAQRAAR